MLINEEQKSALMEKTREYFNQLVTLTPENVYESRIVFHNIISGEEARRIIQALASKETHKFTFGGNNWHMGIFGSIWRDIRIGNKIIRVHLEEESDGVFQTICNVYDTIEVNDWIQPVADSSKPKPQKKSNKSKKSKK